MSNSNSNSDEREYESNTGTQKERKNDPLTEYSEKEPMTPAKIKEHEPTAVKRDPHDQTIVSGGGQTGTDSPQALEEYRRKGMTKVGDDNTTTTTIETSAGQQQYQTRDHQYQESSVENEVSKTVESEVSEAADTVQEGAESTFDKIKAGAKALGKKVTDPDTSIEEEYNKEKSG